LNFSCFNPCFNGSSSSTDVLQNGITLVGNVSILVLMEVPLQPPEAKEEIARKGSFNPCFNGSSSSTWYFVMSLLLEIVSILVLMEVPLQHCDLIANRLNTVFQSLF